MTRRNLARGLIAACHPGPTLVVTVGITAVAAALGQGLVGCLWVLLAVLTGQLSTGWANDAHDAADDLLARREEKPVVRGWVTRRDLWAAAGVAAAACVPLSLLAAGPIGGAAHILAVASAWAYDLWLKPTPWSFLPFVLSFGLLAPFLTYGLTPPRPPAPWAVATLSLLGLGAHLANGIPDIEGDRAVSSEGVVARLGGRLAAILATAALLAGTALLLVHLDLPVALSVAVLAGFALIAAAAARGSGRRLFAMVMALALVNATLLLLNASSILAR